MARFQQGDAVVVAARDQTASDIKSGLYFPHYANLQGKILKVYGEEASVLIDRPSLPDEVRDRHNAGEQAMRQKWLDGLSEEGRNRLSAKEKEFTLNYAVLVSLADLRPGKAGENATLPSAPAAPVATGETAAIVHAALAVNPLTAESDVAASSPNADEPGESGTNAAQSRVSPADLDAREAAYLAEKANATKGRGGKTPA